MVKKAIFRSLALCKFITLLVNLQQNDNRNIATIQSIYTYVQARRVL